MSGRAALWGSWCVQFLGNVYMYRAVHRERGSDAF